MQLLGWIGGIALAICAAPQAWKAFSTMDSSDFSIWFLALWLLGEVCLLCYTWGLRKWPLRLNYGSNIVFILIILRYV
jgi:uncharacterized protein with PQ loop repeat